MPKIGVTSSVQLKRLTRAMEQARRDLEPFRTNRRDFIKQFVGRHYSDSGTSEKVPVNLLELEVSILTRLLAARQPQVLVTTVPAELKSMARNYELALDDAMIELDFAELMNSAVLEACFSAGIIKFGIAQGGEVQVMNDWIPIGEVFMDMVDLDDWVHDTDAKTFKRIQFCGDRAWLDWEWVQESGLYKNLDGLTPAGKQIWDEQGEERADAIDQEDTSRDATYKEQIAIWSMYLPEDNLVVGIPEQNPTRIILEHPWDGPIGGPYRMLSLSRVPGAIMPLSPAALTLDLHELANALFRKVARQAERQKKFGVYNPSGVEDAERLKNVIDGQMIRMDNPENVQEKSVGGADPQTHAMYLTAKETHNWIRGNLDALGGLGPQSETATQDQMLMAAAGKRPDDMQERVTDFARELVRALAWYEWTEPVRSRVLEKPIAGTDMKILTRWSAETRRGEFLHYNFEIQPYSMQPRTPASQLQTLSIVFREFIAPYVGALAEQRITPNFEKILSLIARFTNWSELEEILNFSRPTERQTEGPRGDAQPRMAPHTVRENVRVNRSGTTRAGKDQAMVAWLMQKGQQPSEFAAVTRPAG